MEKSIRVRILNRDYPLRVRPEDEALTREVASFVNHKVESIRQSLPGEPMQTVVILAAMSIAEQLLVEREQGHTRHGDLHRTLLTLSGQLTEALDGANGNGN